MSNAQQQTILRARRGDQSAYTELYDSTINYTYFIASRLLANTNDVQDVLQESYIAAFSKLDEFDETKKFEPWVGTIVRNKAIDLTRRRTEHLLTDEEIGAVSDDEAFLPEEYLEQEDRRRELIAIVDNLPGAQRMAVVLFYFSGLSVAEIARELGSSEGSVKTNLHYGRKKIKEAVLVEERKGNKLYGLVGLPALSAIMQTEAQAAVVPVELSQTVLAGTLESIAAGTAAAGSGSITLAAKFAALSTGAKAGAIAAVAAVVVAAVAIPLSLTGQQAQPLPTEPAISQPEQDAEPMPPEESAAVPVEPSETELSQLEEESSVAAEEISEAPASEPEPAPEESAVAPVAQGYNRITFEGLEWFPAYDGIWSTGYLGDAAPFVSFNGSTPPDFEALKTEIPEQYWRYNGRFESEDSYERVRAFYMQELGGVVEDVRTQSNGKECILTGTANGYNLSVTISDFEGYNIQITFAGSRSPLDSFDRFAYDEVRTGA